MSKPYKTNSKWIPIKCKICGKIIKKLSGVSWNRYYKKKYCNHKCFGKALEKIRHKENNPNWKGNKVKYTALHAWLRRRLKKPNLCANCGKVEPYDLANISQEYKREVDDYKWLCRRCHMKKDGRLNELIKINKNRAKISKENKLAIIKTYNKKTNNIMKLAKKYKVTFQTISKILCVNKYE